MSLEAEAQPLPPEADSAGAALEPEIGDSIMVLKQPWLGYILHGQKTLEIRSRKHTRLAWSGWPKAARYMAVATSKQQRSLPLKSSGRFNTYTFGLQTKILPTSQDFAGCSSLMCMSWLSRCHIGDHGAKLDGILKTDYFSRECIFQPLNLPRLGPRIQF